MARSRERSNVVSRYFSEIRGFPLLSREEERKLARAISSSLRDDSLAREAELIGSRMQAEDGVSLAVRRVEEIAQ